MSNFDFIHLILTILVLCVLIPITIYGTIRILISIANNRLAIWRHLDPEKKSKGKESENENG